MLLNKQATANYQLVQLTVPSNSPNQRFNFLDQPLLRDKAIEKIECYNFGFVYYAPNGTAVALPSTNVFVTFTTDNGNEFIQNIPALELNATTSFAGGYTTLNGGFNIGLRKIVFPKSFLTYSTSQSVGGAYCFLFGVYYR